MKTNVRPIKGQMLALDQSAADVGVEHTVYSHLAYIVPRSDGRVVVGTTVEDRGFDKSVDDDAVDRLRAGASHMAPSLATAPLVESWAGLRPRGPGETPTIGPRGHDGYFVAVGHYRNGILLTPLTAELIAGSVLGTS